MSSNILIVESKNDKYFFDAIISHLNRINRNCDIEIKTPILIANNDYQLMNGSKAAELEKALKDFKADIQKREIEKIGIVVDIDNDSKEAKIKFINDCIQRIFPDSPLINNTNEFINLSFDEFNVSLACYFTNVNGQGELETLLKLIKSSDSIFADCLESWKNCLQNQGQEIKPKDFDKLWVNMYIRFDTCSKQDKKQAERKCSMSGFDYVMEEKADIWNFDHPVLDDLKKFFKMFC